MKSALKIIVLCIIKIGPFSKNFIHCAKLAEKGKLNPLI